jgi:hypothetical protein
MDVLVKLEKLLPVREMLKKRGETVIHEFLYMLYGPRWFRLPVKPDCIPLLQYF